MNAAQRKTLSLAWKKEWGGLIALVLALRGVYATLGVLIVQRDGPVALAEPIYNVVFPYLHQDVISHFLVNPWFNWDTIWYLKIALLGYSAQDSSIAFMPLYPLLIRWTAPLFAGNALLAALALSTVFCSLALILFYELVSQAFEEQLAWGSVFLLMAFPTAFFLLAGYTESLFLLLVFGFWLLALRKRWLLAGLLAGLATLTRLQGLVLTPVLLWMMLTSLIPNLETSLLAQVRQVWNLLVTNFKAVTQAGHKLTWLSALIPVFVAASYQAWLRASRLGSMTAALKAYWHIQTVAPWTGFWMFLQRLFTTHYIYMDWIDLLLFIVIALAALKGLQALDPAYSLYVWLTLAVLFTRGTPPHLLASFSRYFLALFPLFILFARIRNKILWTLIPVLSLCLQALLVWLFLWGSWVA